MKSTILAPTILLILISLTISFPVLAANPYQTLNNNYGVSGGNVKDITSRFCCSGTLGSLVTDGSTKYILSNNHVLARVDQASAGENISQPGLVDNNCQPPRTVGHFTAAVHLGNNVDVAVAQLVAGTMNTSGIIEAIGTPSINVKAPSIGLAVAKSGRTTGTTTGTISSINTSVSVQYQRSCGSGKKFTITYTNQVVVGGSGFSAGGDSGSLILSNTSSNCRQPVALLFAGSSTATIANPIGEDLSKMGQTLGKKLSFVGQNCTAGPTIAAAISTPSASSVDHARNVLASRRNELMAGEAVIGVGIGASKRYPSQAAIVIYMDKTQASRARLPLSIDGVPVRVISTTPFVAF